MIFQKKWRQKQHLVDTMGERENINSQKITQHERKMWKVQKEEPLCKGLQIKRNKSVAPVKVFKSVRQQWVNIHYRRRNQERWNKKRSDEWHLYWWRQKNGKRVVECRIDSGAPCNVISHPPVSKLPQDGNPKLQESNSKLWMYDGSGVILYGVIDIKSEVNQTKTRL